MSTTAFFKNHSFDSFRVRLYRNNIENFFTVDTNFFVLSMENNDVLTSLVNYLKNCNTPSLSLLDLKVVLFTMLFKWE